MFQLRPPNPKRKGVTSVLYWLALITIAARTFDLGAETLTSYFRFHVFQKVSPKGQDGAQQKAAGGPALALNKTATDLSFVFSLSLLRFDFKQDLRTWPILANDFARAPPAP
jgi:hypothetical protein